MININRILYAVGLEGYKAKAKVKNIVQQFLKKEDGDGFLDVLIKMLIVVIIGAALLALLRVAIPDLFEDILRKIRSVFTV